MKLEDIKNKTKDALDYLVQSLESGQSDVLTQYLAAMARFHTYSFGNVMLIARQKPDATNVAGIRTWNSLDLAESNEIGRSVPRTPPNFLEQATHPSLRSPSRGLRHFFHSPPLSIRAEKVLDSSPPSA
jgi:hypothetical protein